MIKTRDVIQIHRYGSYCAQDQSSKYHSFIHEIWSIHQE